MSRATSIWIILDGLRVVRAAFTVKHEMITWLKEQEQSVDISDWTANRFPDNPRTGSHLHASVDAFVVVMCW